MDANPDPGAVAAAARGTPFDLADDDAYRRWRDRKLAGYPETVDGLVVELRDMEQPSSAERGALLARLRKTNMVVYHCPLTEHRVALLGFAGQFGLIHPDRNPAADGEGLSAIRVNDRPHAGEFIPYTDRALRWHTDGYYNPPERRIRAFLLHCVWPAAEGGVNALLDPELLYVRLRDEDPALVAALMHPEAMRVPAHVENGVERRPAVHGPVFAFDPDGGTLLMRYTARTRSIEWRDDAVTRAAVERVATLLAEPPAGTFTLRLEAGMGILCNNVLHSRSAFVDRPDRPGRLLYRARFRARVAGS
ncbi:MAG: TauD/TfdA family dioxygenase [Gammaproteobacteria bacterium]|nr:TauD/TfdA family dioxygenase [Gammaproteobacteria bacterium]